MRKATLIIAISAIILASVGFANYYEHNYTRQATITQINGRTATATDTTGNQWVMYADSLSVGDNVVLKMYDNCTNTITDDEVRNFNRLD